MTLITLGIAIEELFCWTWPKLSKRHRPVVIALQKHKQRHSQETTMQMLPIHPRFYPNGGSKMQGPVLESAFFCLPCVHVDVFVPLTFLSPSLCLICCRTPKKEEQTHPLHPLAKKEAQIDAQKHQLTTAIVSKPSLMPEHQLSLSHLLRIRSYLVR